MSEHDEQAALFRWAGIMTGRYPVLADMYAIPNGGKRDVATAKRLKDEGVKAGIPDIHLPYPAGGYTGLYIEMKYGRNKPTEAQEERMERLKAYGHMTAVCYSWTEAAGVIQRYLTQGRD